jgi:hypothetical protein
MDAMYYVIGTDGRHHGPLSQDDVRRWLAEGLASRYSRARRDGEDQWTALRELPEFEEETRPPHLGGGSTASALAPETSDDASESSVEPRRGTAGPLDPVSCFRRAWYLVAGDFAVLGGWTLLSVVVMIALGFVPGVGAIITLPVNYLLQAAVYALFLLRMRGLRPSVSDIATLIGRSAVQIVVAGLAQALIASPVLLSARVQSKPALFAALVVLLVPCLYLLVGYVFVLPLIVDKQMTAWNAMELSRTTVQRSWFAVCGLLLAAGMLIFVSAAALGFGLVLTLPLCTGALAFAYQDLFDR